MYTHIVISKARFTDSIMSNLGMPPGLLMDCPSIDEAIESANKQVLIEICVAMGVQREGTREILMENLKPKMRDIQDWIIRYRQVDHWTTILERTFGRKDREKSDEMQLSALTHQNLIRYLLVIPI